MGDHGDFWRDVRQAQQEKRAENRVKSAELLKERGLAFEDFNGGAHLRVTHNDVTADFWPGTGRWHIKGAARGYGVKQLIKYLRRNDREEQK